jgi:hypothetical protein
MRGETMECLNAKQPRERDPLADWEIYPRDGFGRPGEPVGGATGLVDTPEAALEAFLASFPELSRYSLIAMQSSIAPPWSAAERL